MGSDIIQTIPFMSYPPSLTSVVFQVYYRVSNATISVANVENAHHSTRLCERSQNQRKFYVLRWERLKDKSRSVLSHFSGSGSLFVFDGQTFDLDYVKVVISNNTKKYPRHKDITRDPQRQGGNIKLDAGKMRRVNHIKYNGAIPDLLFRNVM